MIREAPPPPYVPVVDESEKWAKLVERFNKMKPKAYDGKGDLMTAQRWKDAMVKVFIILKVKDVDRQRLAIYNLEGSAWEWWRSINTNGDLDNLT